MTRISQYFLHSLNQFAGVKIEAYTFGELRCGNKAFADYMNTLTDVTARVVARYNNRFTKNCVCYSLHFFQSFRADIAPHIPPTSVLSLNLLGDDYLHVQTEFYIDGEHGQRFCNQTVYEDRTCSMSLGPVYSALDHVTYFDVDILVCVASNPLAFTSLPLGLFEPTKILPPLPKPISDLTSGITHFATKLLSPLIG